MFAYVALAAWPIVAFFLFRALPRPAALIWTILGGYLLLPMGVGIELPLIPTLDKTFIPAMCAVVLCLMSSDEPAPRRRPAEPNGLAGAETGALPRPPSPGTRQREQTMPDPPRGPLRAPIGLLEWLLLGALVLGPFVTAAQNSEPLVVGPRWMQGLTLYDGASTALVALISVLPYLLARRYLAGEKQQVLLLSGLCLAAVAYTLPALLEVRMSPQLSRWIYGFFYERFVQTLRGDGYRPVVFLQSGLWLTLFLAMGMLAAVALARVVEPLDRGKWLLATGWLLVTLVLCRSLGALAIALAFLPVVAFMPARAQLLLAAAIALVAVSYPALRGAQLIPVDQIVAVSGAISEERASSFNFRLKNEDALLAHANDKPLAGWGGWGRSRIYDEGNGSDISVTDGTWIITIGTYGWLGYLGQFGLLTMPLFALALKGRNQGASLASAGLGLILAGNLIDLVPNATLTPVTWLVAGALMGRAATRLPVLDNPGQPVRQARGWSRSADYSPTRRRAPATPR